MDVNEALELIHQYSPVGGMVMDLFAGTCVTALATLRLNRKCVCVERDQNVVPPARVRLHQWYRWLKSVALLVSCGNPSPWSCTFLTVWCVYSDTVHDLPLQPLESKLLEGKGRRGAGSLLRGILKPKEWTLPCPPVLIPETIPATVHDDARLCGQFE